MAQNSEIRWSAWAWEDLRDLAEYITGRDGAEAARRQCEKIADGFDSLSTLPRRCRIVPELREIGVEAYRELIIAPYILSN